jgi:CHAT domain-containing protein
MPVGGRSRNDRPGGRSSPGRASHSAHSDANYTSALRQGGLSEVFMSKRRIAMVWVGLLAGGLASQARAADEPPVPAAEAAYRTGDLETAIRLWEKSLPRLEAGEALEVRARVANARRKLGELDAAARALGPLLEAAIARKDAPREALVRHYRGRLALDLGRPAEAAVDLRVALALYRRLGDARNVSALSTALAGSEYLAGHVDTAYAEYDAILEAARQARDLRGEGDALVGLGGCLSTIQEHRMAASLFVQAAEVLSGAGFADRADLAHLEAAQSLLWAGRPAEAQALVERASRGAGQSADIRARLTLLAAQMDLRRGDAERAMGWLEAELKAQPAGRSGRLEAALWIARAAILLKVARWAEADAALKALEAMTLAPMDQSELDTMRGFRLLRTGKAAEALAPLRRAAAKEDALWRAFDPETLTGMADAAILPRAGGLLAEAELRAGTPEDALEAVARAQARATALAIQADPGPAGDSPESMTERVKRRVRLHTRLVAASSVPNAAALRASPRVAAGQVALLDFHLLPDRVDMLWVDAGGVRHRHVDVDAATLEAEVRTLAAAVERPTGAWQAASRTLGERLLGPWRAELKAAEKAGVRLALVPHGVLHRTPFAALLLDDRLLADRVDEFYLPNAGLLARPPESTDWHDARILAVGDARGGGPTLPGARTELTFLAERFGARELRALDATTQALSAAVVGVDVIHIAAHGHRAAAGRPAHLALTPVGGDDGRLTPERIADLKLDARLVVLAACESASGTPEPSDDMPDALDRAFLVAGAGAVLGARWALDDRTAARFSRSYYEHLPSDGRLGALSRARRAIREDGVQETSDASVARGMRPASERADPRHPYAWAAYVLNGRDE